MLSVFNTPDLEFVASAYRYSVALGQPATEPTLIASLEKYGDARMATCFLNSENETLSKAGMAWAKAHDYIVVSGGSAGQNTTWGSRK